MRLPEGTGRKAEKQMVFFAAPGMASKRPNREIPIPAARLRNGPERAAGKQHEAENKLIVLDGPPMERGRRAE